MAGFQTILPYLSHEIMFRDQNQSQNQALRELQDKQSENLRALEENAALQKSRVSEESAQAERQRRAALKRATARQRAAFGGQGVSSPGGSGEAVLLGLFQESDADRQERERLDNLRLQSIDQDLAQQRRLNVLQMEQLRQRQNLGRASSNFDRFSNIFTGLFG